MSDREVTHSDLVEIAKRNGDFRKNYGLLVGAFLYLRSIMQPALDCSGGKASWRVLPVCWVFGRSETVCRLLFV